MEVWRWAIGALRGAAFFPIACTPTLAPAAPLPAPSATCAQVCAERCATDPTCPEWCEAGRAELEPHDAEAVCSTSP